MGISQFVNSFHSLALTQVARFSTVCKLMARVCQMTGKKGSTGNLRSHSLHATRRTFKANIVKKRVFDPKTGKYVRMKVATSYLRTLAKQLQQGR